MCLPMPNLEDRTLEKGEHLGFEYQIVHNGLGYRCGYIKVLPGHPWYGLDYDNIAVDVHGGLTFAQAGIACPPHGPEDEWWVGFDCAHAFDAPDPDLPHPGSPLYYKEIPGFRGYTIKDTQYVREQCELLCMQAALAAQVAS